MLMLRKLNVLFEIVTHYTNAKLIDKKHQNMLNILNVNLHFLITSVSS